MQIEVPASAWLCHSHLLPMQSFMLMHSAHGFDVQICYASRRGTCPRLHPDKRIICKLGMQHMHTMIAHVCVTTCLDAGEYILKYV